MSFPRPDWAALGIGVALAIALVVWELRATQPFFDVRLLATNLALTRTYLRFAVAMLCSYTVLYGISQWLEAGRGLSAQQTGLVLLPNSVISIFLIRQVSKRNLVRGPLLFSASASLFASLAIQTLATRSSIVGIMSVTVVFGLAGLAYPTNQLILYTQVRAGEIGTASGLFRTWGYLGSIASSAVIAIVFGARATDHGLHTIGWIMAIASALGLLLILTDREIMRTRHARREPEVPSTAGGEETDSHAIRQFQHAPAAEGGIEA
jgi:predicted MFS family arabinose efflux permease